MRLCDGGLIPPVCVGLNPNVMQLRAFIGWLAHLSFWLSKEGKRELYCEMQINHLRRGKGTVFLAFLYHSRTETDGSRSEDTLNLSRAIYHFWLHPHDLITCQRLQLNTPSHRGLSFNMWILGERTLSL